MTNAELIKALRYCSDNEKEEGCDECPYLHNGMCDTMLSDAAYALEADEKRIAELEAQLPKEGDTFTLNENTLYRIMYAAIVHGIRDCVPDIEKAVYNAVKVAWGE